MLTDYAVAARYPGPSEPVLIEDYEKALATAKAVVSWVSDIVAASFEPEGEARERLEPWPTCEPASRPPQLARRLDQSLNSQAP